MRALPRTICLLCCLLAVAAMAAPALSAPTIITTITYQGFLKDSGGLPITGSPTLAFNIYAAPTGGAALWTEAHAATPVSVGLFNVQLGSINPFPASLFLGTALYLETVVTGTALTPRALIGSTPYAIYAYRAAVADSVVGGAGMRNFAVRLGNSVSTAGSLSTPANCNPGEVAVGGGGLVTGSSGGIGVMSGSRPQPEVVGNTPTGWRLSARNTSATGQITAQAYVVCASP